MRRYLISLAVLGGAVLAAGRRDRKLSPTRPGPIAGSGKYDWIVHCESTYQQALENLAGQTSADDEARYCTAMLILEGSGLYDTDRVRVEIDDRTVGYLAPADAVKYRNTRPAKVMSASAFIVGDRDDSHGYSAHYGVKLDLPGD